MTCTTKPRGCTNRMWPLARKDFPGQVTDALNKRSRAAPGTHLLPVSDLGLTLYVHARRQAPGEQVLSATQKS